MRADYQLDVETPGEYEPTVAFVGTAPRDVTFAVGTPAVSG